MRTEITNLYKDLLSLQGHVVDGRIEDEATGLAPRDTHWFDSFLLLGGRDVDTHQADDAIVSPEKIGIAHC